MLGARLVELGDHRRRVADERESLLWGFVNMLDGQVRRLDRAADRLMPELRDLQRAQDGTEIKSRELELVTDRAQNLTDRRDAFEIMRDAAGEAYRADTGDTWRPRRGSHASQTGQLTSAAIDARDFQRARKDRETAAHLPQGTLVAIAGGKDVAELEPVRRDALAPRAPWRWRALAARHAQALGAARGDLPVVAFPI